MTLIASPADTTADRFKACALPVVESIRAIARAKGEPYVLDLGCGNGSLTIPSAVMMPDAMFYGIDADPQMVAQLKKNATVCGAGNIIPMRMGSGIPERCETLWGVFSMGLLPTLTHPEAWPILRAIARALVPGCIARIDAAEYVADLRAWGLEIKATDVTPFGTFITARKPL